MNEGFGDRLCQTARSLDEPDFKTYLINWRQEICRFLRCNSIPSLASRRSRHAALANSFPSNFPDPTIVRFFTNPIVSSADTIQQFNLTSVLPDVSAITRQCELRFEWGTAKGILEKFEKDFLPAVLLYVLVEEASTRKQNGSQPLLKVSKPKTIVIFRALDTDKTLHSSPLHIISSMIYFPKRHLPLAHPAHCEELNSVRFQDLPSI